MPERRARGRQCRPDARSRGWMTPREYATAIGRSPRTVRHWCQQGRVFNADGRAIPVHGGDGTDYQIPLAALGCR